MVLRVAIFTLLALPALGQFSRKSIEVRGDWMFLTLSDPNIFVGQIFAAEPSVGHRVLDPNIGQTLTGDPFSAQHISEHIRTLADGAHVKQRLESKKIWRDSQGRSRTEVQIGVAQDDGQGDAFILTEIRDPVGMVFYVLDDPNRIAYRLILKSDPVPIREPRMVTPMRVHIGCLIERLGPQSIEGVIASGWRDSCKIGSRRSQEAWFSDETGMEVLFRQSDPKDGETITRWINISRAEPDLALFQPPADYSIVDAKDSVTIELKRQ